MSEEKEWIVCVEGSWSRRRAKGGDRQRDRRSYWGYDKNYKREVFGVDLRDAKRMTEREARAITRFERHRSGGKPIALPLLIAALGHESRR